MNFELLANELLLDLFEYLDTNDLFHAFYNLNIRLNELLFTHCQLHGNLNFQSISKNICRINHHVDHYCLTSTQSSNSSENDSISC